MPQNNELRKKNEDLEKKESTIQEQIDKLRLIEENFQDVIWIFNLDIDRFTYVSPSVKILTGYDAEEFLGFGIKKILTPESANLVEKTLPIQFEKMGNRKELSETITIEVQEFHKKGKITDVEIRATCRFNKKGEKEVFGISRNITERKEIQEALRRSELQFSKMFEFTPVMLLLADFESLTILNVNRAYEKSIGFTKSEVVNKPGKLGFTMDVKTVEIFKKKILEGQKLSGQEVQLITKSGHMIDGLVYSESIDIENRKLLIFSVVDITKQKQMQNELLKAKEKAEESDRLKSAFLANMSHEIRTPMNGIMGFAELLKMPQLSTDQQKQYIEIIENSGHRMLNIINDLIDISKIEAGMVTVNKTKLFVKNQIEYLCTFFKPEAEKKKLQFQFNFEHIPEQMSVITDAEKVNSILMNFIKNAVKYTNTGSIKVSLTDHDTHLLYQIKDTGIGIAKEKHDAIFERFVQADLEINKPYEGAGLGLAITKAYAEMLGGKVWVESTPNIGSSFYFQLPKYKSDFVDPVKDKESNEVSTFEDLSVLIVDDDEISILYLTELLAGKVKKIESVKTGNEAISILKKHNNIDVVLLDLKMSPKDGFQTAREIRTFNNKIIIIAQTAYALAGDEQKAIGAGCNAYISKPVQRKELINKIRNNLV